ncbi:MAG: DNA/RNA helicase domain-containing protein, partial [Acidimicrobiales bacterium]
ATKRSEEASPTHATFLSGNGPLVAVLREALTRDELARLRKQGQRVRKGEAGLKVKAFIQNVHHFRDEGLRHAAAPADRVVIFDEAQRAWNRRKTADFMQRRKNTPGFTLSEPEFLISVLDRHADWAAVICLVGGGQEINDGEAGISAWLQAVRDRFPGWHVYLSPALTDSEYAAGGALDSLTAHQHVSYDQSLHLAVSMRSFRADNVSRFVKAVLDCDSSTARDVHHTMSTRYPVALTRDLELAREWVRKRARASERYGIVASSQAQRLKPHAIDVRVEINPVMWFLNGPEDTRSSWYLEDAATEFQVQGLELDWVCVTWDADLRFRGSAWSYHSFRGSNWTTVRKPDRQLYQKNAYRVLLTRARQGMVIFVPPGDPRDPTRAPDYYDATYNYLKDIGLPVLQGR